MKLFNKDRVIVRPVFGKAVRKEFTTRPPEGNGLADGRSDARRSERSPQLRTDAPAAASDLPFDRERP